MSQRKPEGTSVDFEPDSSVTTEGESKPVKPVEEAEQEQEADEADILELERHNDCKDDAAAEDPVLTVTSEAYEQKVKKTEQTREDISEDCIENKDEEEKKSESYHSDTETSEHDKENINPDVQEAEIDTGLASEITLVKGDHSGIEISISEEFQGTEPEFDEESESELSLTRPAAEGREERVNDSVVQVEEAKLDSTGHEDQETIPTEDLVLREVLKQDNKTSPDTVEESEEQSPMDTDTRPPAFCKFRYAKTVPTDASSVIFFTSKDPKEPIVLTWSDTDSAYLSQEMTVECGDFHGNVLINGKTHPVEEFSVRTYTFEIDLYLTEDIIEDEVGAYETQAQEEEFQRSLRPQVVDTFSDINSDLAALTKMANNDESGIHLSSKYEELVRQQLAHKEIFSSSLENELNSPNHSQNSSKRQTPVGDANAMQEKELFSQYDLTPNSSPKHTSQCEQTVVETREIMYKSNYSQPSSRSVSEFSGSLPSYNRVSPYKEKTDETESQRFIEGQDQRSLDNFQRQTSEEERRSLSSRGLVRQTPERSTDEIVNRSSHSSRQTPEPIADVLEHQKSINPQRSAHSSTRTTPQKELLRDDTTNFASPVHLQRQSPAREVITDVLRSSQEILYESQEISRPGSRPSSSGGSRHSVSSRQQSITSEQELAQYLDDPGRARDIPRRAASLTGLNQADSLLPPLSAQGTSSVPPLAGRRITTPDNHIRIPNNTSPALRSPLITSRASTSSNDSCLSNKTVTPVENVSKENMRKIHDLEQSITNLRKLLSSREAEIYQLTDQIRDLRDINRSLCQELEHFKKQMGTVDNREIQKEMNQLRTEKEILAKEVVKLQDMLKTRGVETTGLDSYSPNNPSVLQRKIVDLEGHIQDMQEVNETAVAKLTKAERQVHELMAENEKLRNSRSLTLQDLKDDNRRLEEKIRELRAGQSEFRCQSELQQFKEELCLPQDHLNYGMREQTVHWKHEPIDTRQMSQSHTTDRQLLDIQTNTLTHSRTEKDSLVSHSDIRQNSEREQRYSSDYRSSVVRDRQVPHDTGIGYGREGMYQKTPQLKDLPERYPLTKENISSLERSYGSDRGQEDKLRSEGSYLDKYRILTSAHEKPRSEKTGFLHSNRPLPDGEVSEIIVQDGLKPSRRHYERNVDDISIQQKDDFSMERFDRRDHLGKTALKTAPLNSREIYYSLREKNQSHSETPYSLWDCDVKKLQNTPHYGDTTSPVIGNETYPSSYNYCSKYDAAENQRHFPGTGDVPGYLISGFSRKHTDVGIPKRNLSDIDIEFNQDFDSHHKTHQDDLGEVSDTATDLLLRGEVVDKKTARSKRWCRRRSVDSDSLSSLSDTGDEITSRQRSKSVDARENWRNSRMPTAASNRTLPPTQYRLSTSTERLASGSGSQGSGSHGNIGLRSVTCSQLVTQHNKHSISNPSLNSSLTYGLKPFAPRTPGDVTIGDVVKFSRQGGKLSQGTVKYVGHLPGRSDAYLGVELHKEEGKHDGMFDGIRYFKCKANKGVFVAFNKVVMAWGL